MKKLLFLGLLPLLFASCTKDSGCYPPDGPQSPEAAASQVEISFAAADNGFPTRNSEDENAIADVNLYLHNVQTGSLEHHYLTAGNASRTMTMAHGRYEAYAIANTKEDMGPMTLLRLQEAMYVPDVSGDTDERFAMSGRQSFTVSGATDVAILLRRCVAKLTLNVTTAGAFTDFELRSCQVTGVPSCVPFFAESKPTADGGVTSFPKSVLSGRSYSVVLYLPENAQGEVPGISDPQQRSRENAPQYATCIHHEGEASGCKVDYYIYPGSNATTSFDILRNRHYNLDVMISGANAADMRLSTLGVAFTELPQTCSVGDNIFTEMRVESTDPDGRYTLTVEQAKGEGTITFDGMAMTTGIPVTLPGGAGTKTARIGYCPTVAGEAVLTFVLRDAYDYEIRRTLTTEAVEKPSLDITLTPPSAIVVGNPATFTLEISGSDDTAISTFTCSDPQAVFVFPAGTGLGGNEAMLGNGTHNFLLDTRATGDLTVTVRVSDGSGQSVQQQCTVTSRYPKFSAMIRTMSSAALYSDSPMTLTIRSTEYMGDYTVSYTTTSTNCRVSYDGSMLHPDSPVTLEAGQHIFTANSSYAERTEFVFTITDIYGQSQQARASITWR